VNKKSQATFFLENEKYLNCDQKNKKLSSRLLLKIQFTVAV
jgi:hypothetical protein